MGPEDDLKREIRALLRERKWMDVDDIARELQRHFTDVLDALGGMSDVESSSGFAQTTKYYLRAERGRYESCSAE